MPLQEYICTNGMFLFPASGDDLTCYICGEDMPPCSNSTLMNTADDQLIPCATSQTDMLDENLKL